MTASVRVVHSIVCCRILLNIRRAASPGDGSTVTESTGLVFATAPRPERSQVDTIQLEVYGVRSGEEDYRHGDSVVGRSS